MTEYYIANNGQDISGNGTLLNPFLTLKYANTQCSDGDTLIFRGGNYELEETTITKEVTIKSYELDEDALIPNSDLSVKISYCLVDAKDDDCPEDKINEMNIKQIDPDELIMGFMEENAELVENFGTLDI